MLTDNTATINICKKEIKVSEILRRAGEGLTAKQTLELWGISYKTAEKDPNYRDFKSVLTRGRTSLISRTFTALLKKAEEGDVYAQKHLLGKLSPNLYSGTIVEDLEFPPGATTLEKSDIIFNMLSAGNMTCEQAKLLIDTLKTKTDISKSIEAIETINLLKTIPGVAEAIEKHMQNLPPQK